MKDYLKFNSDKSFVHEVTYLTDAEYDLAKSNHKRRIDTILATIKQNKWYNADGKDITKTIHSIKPNRQNISGYLDKIKDTLENK